MEYEQMVDKHKNKKISKKLENNCISGLWVSLFIAVTFGIFGPLGIYLTNISEFWFSIGDIWWIVLLGGLLLFLVFFCMSFMFKGRGREIFVCLIFGASFGFYVQGNWINIDYGLLDGKNIDWSKYTGAAIMNTLIWVLCIILPFAFRLIIPRLWKSIIKYMVLFLVLLQVVTLGTLLVTANINQNDSDTYLSTEGEFSLSKNKNIVIFILDAFDTSYFKALLEENPEAAVTFKNFTYYPDTVAGAALTKVALPAILTGMPYTVPMSYKDYIEYAYTQTELYKTLKRYNYSTGIYTLTTFVPSSQKDLIDNLSTGKSKIGSHSLLTKHLYQLTAFRYMPHLLKSNFWVYSGVFEELRHGSNTESYSTSNVKFYQRLLDNRITADDKYNAFRFYYLQGAHPPYDMNEYAQQVPSDETSQLQQAKGSLHIIEEYMTQLKDAGIYDNTTILIMADHGDVGHHHNPLFMMKLSGESMEFEISYAPLSYYDLHATLLSIITGNERDYGDTVFDFEEGDKRLRYFYYDRSKNNITSIIEYAINDYAGNKSSVIATGNIYTGVSGSGAAYEYKLGAMLTFGPDGTALPYCVSGFSRTDAGDYAWTDGKSAEMRFDLSEIPKQDLNVRIFSMVYSNAGSQRMIVKDGEEIVHAGTYDKTSTIEFAIPKELLEDKTLLLDFEFPDAVCPYDLFGSGNDYRTLAFALMDITISEGTLENSTNIPSYNIGDVIEFTKDNDGTRYFINGIGKVNDGHAWSTGNSGWLLMKTGETGYDLNCKIDLVNVLNGKQRLIISSNGEILFNGIVTSENKKIDFRIPAKYIATQFVSLKFEYPDAASSLKLGVGKDNRILAAAFKTITFEKAEVVSDEVLFTNGSFIIDFTKSGNSEQYITKSTDWYAQEETHRWTGKYAELHTTINTEEELTMIIDGFIHHLSGGSVVTLNGTVVASLDAGDGFKQYKIKLPCELLNVEGIQTIAFSSKKAVSPYEAGIGADKRELGIALRSITFTKASAENNG